MAARMGLGALTFGFLSPTDANKWAQDYYQELSECQPLAYSVNPNVGFLSAFMCDRNAERALMMGLDGPMFFGYAFRHHYVDGLHRPAKTDLWSTFKNTPIDQLLQLGGGNLSASHCLGSPHFTVREAQTRGHLRLVGAVRQDRTA